MRIQTVLLVAILTLIHWSCTPGKGGNGDDLIALFPNTLDISGTPSKPKDRSVYSFSDLGAWHSYSLSTKPSGGFVGPFLMTDDNGLWAAEQLVTFDLWKKNKKLDWKTAQLIRSDYLPGQLIQRYQIDDLIITQRLIFVSNRSTLVQYELLSEEKQSNLEAGFSGRTWLEGWVFDAKENRLLLGSGDSKTQVLITLPQEYNVDANESAFESSKVEFELNPYFPLEISYLQSSCFSDEEVAKELSLIEKAMANPAWCFESYTKRWNGYLQRTLTRKNGSAVDSVYHTLAVKALNTLVNNWRSAAGELNHDGLFPSYAYGGFHGFWAWDSWKHAVGLSDIIPQLAKDQILAMYDFQDEDGMIADCIFRDTLIENHNWRDTKPPLSAWSVVEVFQSTGDTAWVRDLFPKMVSYHTWWYKFRDHDNNGLCEYGSTDGTRIAAAWESGMDNAVRFDLAEMRTNKGGGFSLNQESVDLNAYLYAEKQYLSGLADVLDEREVSLQYKAEALELAGSIKSKFYAAQEGYFFDVMHDGQSIKIYGPEAWIPLWVGLATDQQASGVVDKIMDETKFNTTVPLPTLDASHAQFNPKNGYWRGPVWLDQFYFAIKGLQEYGYENEASLLKQKLFENAEGLMTQEPIRENYHPLTGEGLNARHFSWSAANLLMLIRE